MRFSIKKSLVSYFACLIAVLPVAWAFSAETSETDIRLAVSSCFSANMVLPYGTPIPVTGQADRYVGITVRFGTQTCQTKADGQGRWRVELSPMPASLKPETLEIRTERDSIRLENILVGEVWLCAGQSNMLFELKHCESGNETADAIAATSANETAIRFLKRSPRNGWQAAATFDGSWKQGSAAEAKNFSGVGCFFALHRSRSRPGVPIGMISVSYGGVPIESFLDRETLLDSPLRDCVIHTPWYEHADYAPWCAQRAKDEIKQFVERQRATQDNAVSSSEPDHLFGPGRIYKTGLADLAGFPLTGVLWYQGESNATSNLSPDLPSDAEHNEQAMRLLIGQFRRDFPKAHGQSEHLPFCMVQLPKMNRPWAEYRASQWKVARELPDVIAVVTTDTGNPNDVHPRDKATVGQRLAEAARQLVDGQADAAVFPEAIEARYTDRRIEIRFTPPGQLIFDGDEVTGLQIVDQNGNVMPANATLEKSAAGTCLIINVGQETVPCEVRYNWVNVPQGNLYSGQRLPVTPFRLELNKDK